MTDINTLRRQLEALRTAYRSGASEISYEGKRISYRDSDGMRAAIASLESEVAKAEGRKPFGVAVVRSNKGW